MNTFSAGTSLRAGWDTFNKRSGYFVGATAIVMVATWIIGMVSSAIGGHSFVSSIVSLLLQTFVGMGVVAFGLKAFEDPSKSDFMDLWHPQQYVNYLLASIIVMVSVAIGFVLLIVPGVIVAVMFSMTKFLVVSRDMKPVDAIKESIRMTEGNRLELFLLVLAAIGINILGAVCLVVGLLVTIPTTMFAFVSAFRTLEQKASAVAAAPIA